MIVEPSTRPAPHWLSQLSCHEKVEQHHGMEGVKGFKQENDRDKRSSPALRDRYKMVITPPLMISYLKQQIESHQALEIATSLQDF